MGGGQREAGCVCVWGVRRIERGPERGCVRAFLWGGGSRKKPRSMMCVIEGGGGEAWKQDACDFWRESRKQEMCRGVERSPEAGCVWLG